MCPIIRLAGTYRTLICKGENEIGIRDPGSLLSFAFVYFFVRHFEQCNDCRQVLKHRHPHRSKNLLVCIHSSTQEIYAGLILGRAAIFGHLKNIIWCINLNKRYIFFNQG